jgi:replication factor C subunit 1
VATSPKASKVKPTVNGKKGKKGVKSYSKVKAEDDDFEDLDNDDNIFAADYKNGTSRGDDYDDGSDAEDEPLPHRGSRSRGKQAKIIKEEDDYQDDDIDMKGGDAKDSFVVSDDDEEFVGNKPKKRANNSKKRKSEELEDDEDEPSPKKGKGGAKPKTAKPRTPKAKKEEVEDSAELKGIFADIPLVRAPTPPPKDKDNKFNYRDHVANRAAPAAANSKELPTGAENCLAGLTFVFTGVLESLERETGQALVKRHGGKVVGAPSGKTSYVVLGADAGPSKLQKIKDNNLKTINEDGLFQLIRRLPANGGDGKAAAAAGEKSRKEENEAMKRAHEMEEQAMAERAAEKARVKQLQKTNVASGKAALAPRQAVIPESSKLWTVKYNPTSVQQVVGNKGQVEKLAKWLRAFPKSLKMNFKLGGIDGTGIYRAVMIHGPPGVGKTTAAHLVAKLEGYDIVENNASDTRSKKLMEESLRGVLSTTSLLGYFAGDGKRVEESKKKLVLIMDEVDGMSAGDRGGVGALAAVCKKTRVPIILICNDRKLAKMKPFDHVTYDMPFRRPNTDQIRSRIMTIVYREQLKIPPNVVNALIEGTNADIRQVVNMISTAKLDDAGLDFESGKDMSKAWQKHVILKPWDIVSKILGGGMFAANSSSSLNEKIELYFNDHEFSYLMLQENYLSTQPILANSYQGREKRLKQLELADKAAQSISDGDLVDRLIHGSQQQWSLMPAHAVFSFVRPASFISGSQAGSQTRFTSWLGNNSKLGKLTRMVKEIQGHMRLRASGDRHEVRQQYVPTLWNMMPKRLEVEGKEAVQPVIDLMDSYFLARDDLDAISELGVGPLDMERYLKIEPQVKSTFTRLYV